MAQDTRIHRPLGGASRWTTSPVPLEDRGPPSIRAILLIPWFAWMSWIMTWSAHPVAWGRWTPTAKMEMACWAALLVAIGILWATVRSGRRIDRLAPILLGGHILLGTCVAVLGHTSSTAWLVGAIGLLVSMPATFMLSTGRKDRTKLRPILEAICASILLPALVLLVWSPINMLVLRHGALSMAKGDPFCIQVPADYFGRERQATHWGQLTGLQMHTPWTNGGGSEDYQFAFHAILVVDRGGKEELYNWSYLRQGFQPVEAKAIRGLYLRSECEPDISFFDGLEWSGSWERFVPPVYPMPIPLPQAPADRLEETIVPIDPASTWEMAFWTDMFVRYAGMRAMIDVCNLRVDRPIVWQIERREKEARLRLGASEALADKTYQRIRTDTLTKGIGLCDRGSRQHQDMMSSFPGVGSGQR